MDNQSELKIDAASITMGGKGPHRSMTVEFSALDEPATIAARFKVAAEVAQGLMACWRGDEGDDA